METRVFIITDYDYINDDLRITRSEHYCVQFEETDENEEKLFQKALAVLGIDAKTVCEWWVD